jgi:sulfite reductase alpha subunit-like flavoprotein
VALSIRRGALSLALAAAASTNAPLILIAPGTGIAPMRAVVQQHAADVAAAGAAALHKVSGTTALRDSLARRAIAVVFGCRHRNRDWLYGEEMSALQGNGALAVYATAFSRDQAAKEYVQHKLTAPPLAATLARWIVDEVCGCHSALSG